MAAESITVVHSDTDVTPYDMATLGSRSLFHMGNAVKLAAEDALKKLNQSEKRAAAAADCPIPEIFKKKYGMQAGNVVGTGSYIPSYKSPDANGLTDNATPFWMVGGSGAEVEVDTETGRVRVTRLVNVADVGTPINPKIVETQISGAAIMQLGFTLFEKMEFDAQGQLRNASFAEYKIPGMLDLPDSMTSEAVVAEQKTGPYGGKGVGESGTFGVSPAIANAIHDAVGVRLTELPLNPQAVWEETQVRREIRFKLNGEAVSAQVAPHENLVEVLQESFGLYGARESCGQGMCGCCTVLVDGRAVSGCLYLASLVEDSEVHDRNRRRTGCGAAGLRRGERVPVRFLHAGFRADDAPAAGRASRSRRRHHQALPVGKSVSLRGLPGNHRGG